MIGLTLEECENFEYHPIDYSKAEGQKRENNKNMLVSLLEVENNKDCMEYLNQSPTNLENLRIPYKLKVFYQKYFDADSVVDVKTMHKAINKEIKDIEDKIRNFCNKWGYEQEFIKKVIFEDDMFALFFIKEPGRQTFHQHYAAQWIKELPFVEEFVEPSAGGQNALYVSDIGVFSNRSTQSTGKSIDFTWSYTFGGKKLKFYATHKYTNENGGSQDNQYRDVQDFHRTAKESIEPNDYFLSITDGAYYQAKESSIRNQNLTRLEYLQQPGRFKGSRNNATTCNNFSKDVIDVIKKWLQDNFREDEIQNEIEKLDVLSIKCS